MTADGLLERRYRRLLRALPAPERMARGDEMLGVFLEGARPGQTRPGVADTLDLLRAAGRSRARCLLVTDPVARLGAVCAAVLLLGGLLLGALDLERRGILDGPATAQGPVLPGQFPHWDPRPATVGHSPAGPTILAYVDGHEDIEEFLVLLGADGTSARRMPLPGNLRSGVPFLLAADGSALADTFTGVLRVTDLSSGRARRVAGPQLDADTRLAAWSVDGTRVALVSARSTAVVTLAADTLASDRVLSLPGGASSAAFAPDGRLALAHGPVLEVYAPDATLLGSGALPVGTSIAPAGWSADGSTLALMDVVADGPSYASDTSWVPGLPALHQPATGDLPALVGRSGTAVPLAWQGGSLLLAGSGSTWSWDPATLSSTVVTRAASGWYVEDLRAATGLAGRAHSAPLQRLDRGPLGLTPYFAASLVALALLGGWLHPPTPGRLRARTVPAALAEAERPLVSAGAITLPLAGIYWAATGMVALERNLLYVVLTLLALGSYALGRSLGRARDIPEPRTAVLVTATQSR